MSTNQIVIHGIQRKNRCAWRKALARFLTASGKDTWVFCEQLKNKDYNVDIRPLFCVYYIYIHNI